MLGLSHCIRALLAAKRTTSSLSDFRTIGMRSKHDLSDRLSKILRSRSGDTAQASWLYATLMESPIGHGACTLTAGGSYSTTSTSHWMRRLLAVGPRRHSGKPIRGARPETAEGANLSFGASSTAGEPKTQPVSQQHRTTTPHPPIILVSTVSIFNWSYDAFRGYTLFGVYFIGIPLAILQGLVGLHGFFLVANLLMLLLLWGASVVNASLIVAAGESEEASSFAKRELPKHAGGLFAAGLVIATLSTLATAVLA